MQQLRPRLYLLFAALAAVLLASAALADGLQIGIGISIPERSTGGSGPPAVAGNLLLVGGGNILLVGGGKLQCVGPC